MELENITEKILGAAIQVHRTLGSGFLESIYENALCEELSYLGVPFKKQLEAIKELQDIHFSQTRSYLQALQLKHGLLLNFATHPLTIKRVINQLTKI